MVYDSVIRLSVKIRNVMQTSEFRRTDGMGWDAMDDDLYGFLCMYGRMNVWISVYVYGRIDVWMYGCIDI